MLMKNNFYKIIVALLFSFGAHTLNAQLVVKDSESYKLLEEHIGSKTVELLQNTQQASNYIREKPYLAYPRTMYHFTFNNHLDNGLSEHQLDSLNYLLNNIYLDIYSIIQSRDILHYQSPYQQQGIVEKYDSICVLLNNLYPYISEYKSNKKPLHHSSNISLCVLTGINQIVSIDISPVSWVERTLIFSELTYNTVTTMPIQDDAKDGLAGHKQITKVDVYYNENRQVAMDVNISLETNQQIFEAHYVAGMGSEKRRSKYRKFFSGTKEENSEKWFQYRFSSKLPEECFCEGKEYCPITFLLMKYNIHEGSGMGQNIFSGNYCFPFVDEIREIKIGFTEYHWYPNKAAYDDYIKLSGIELIPTGWEYIWYPDGRLFSKNFYATPFFPENGEYGRPNSTGMVIDPENVIDFETYDVIGTVGTKYNILGNTIVYQDSISDIMWREHYFTVDDTLLQKQKIIYNYNGTVDTIKTNFSKYATNFAYTEAAILFGQHSTGIPWPLKDSKKKESTDSNRALYRINGKQKMIFIPYK